MMMKQSWKLIGLLVFALPCQQAMSQATWSGDSGNWTDTTWNDGTGPDGTPGAGQGIVLPGTTGTVSVTTDTSADVGAYNTLSQAGGVLSIAPGGSLDFTGLVRLADGGSSSGQLHVEGNLNVGGGLDVGYGTGGGGDSQGTLSIAGNANVSVGGIVDTWWDPEAVLEVTGDAASIEFNAAPGIFVGPTATVRANINSDSFSVINASSEVSIQGGTLEVNFVDGYEPPVVLGKSWTIFDTGTVGGTGAFTNVDLPFSGFGTNLVVNYPDGGEHGKLITVDVVSTLNLLVNADGSVAIENPVAGATAMDIDGYIIKSAGGALSEGNLAGMGEGWLPGLAPSQSANLISETNITGSTLVSEGDSMRLGDIFNGAAQDLTFEYYVAGAGTLLGTVQYVGGLGCDVNGDGVCDAGDIDAMTQMVIDGTATQDERTALIESPTPDGLNTWIGDSDMNGQFDEQDIVAAFVAGQYLTGERAGWVEGDWDGNFLFNEQDFVAAFVAGGYLLGPRGAAAAVPEPSSAVLLLLGLLAIRRPRRTR